MTKVIFRRVWWKDQRRWEVLAFFPEAHVNVGNILCYAHIGQHSEASAEFYNKTRSCVESDYMELKRELENVCGYDDIKIVKKWVQQDKRKAWYLHGN